MKFPHKMRVVICGSRHLKSYRAIQDAIQSAGLIGNISTVISGGCRGADSLGEAWAKANGVPVQIITAKWAENGKAAGPIRNRLMAFHANAVVAIRIQGIESKGTDDMVRQAVARKLPVYEYTVSQDVAFKDDNPNRCRYFRSLAEQMEYRPRIVRKDQV